MRLGLGGTLVVLVLSVIFGRNFFSDLGGGSAAPASGSYAERSADPNRDAGERREVQFVSFVLDDAQNTWETLLAQNGNQYRHAKLVLFRDVTDSGCGTAQSATGPFYCPEDEKVYIDLGFFDELSRRFGAPGEFAQAYVLAHEIGHHVQKLLGIEQRVSRLQQAEPARRNELSVQLELQADCLAGVWGNSTRERNLVDRSDIAAGMNAAAAVGDDRLQRMAQGRVSPESFTHGSSEQRMNSFRRGLDSGDLSACSATR